MRLKLIFLCSLLLILGVWVGEARAQDVDAVIPYTSTPPTIDGMGSDFDPVWDDVEGHGFDEFITVVGAPPEDETDLGPTWKALWDEDNLYVLVEVVDLVINNTVDCNWDDDSVEILIDAQDINSEDFQFGSNPPAGVPAYQFTTVAGDQAGGPFCNPGNEKNENSAFTLGINSYDTGDEATRFPQGEDTTTGSQQGDVFYVVEAAFPWDALEETTDNIRARGSFGFSVGVNDDDDNSSRQTQVLWASDSPDFWMRSDVFPSVALGDPPTPGADCDFNDDDFCNGADIDQLMNDAETGGTSTDLNGDGVVNDMDRDEWLALAGPENGFAGAFLVGDADLNGKVEPADLNEVGLSWQNEAQFNYTNGNFTIGGGPGVRVNDLNGLGLNWQNEVAMAAAGQAVPEPTAFALILAGLLGLFTLRRR